MNESQLQTYYLFEPVVAWRAWLIQAHDAYPPWRPKMWWQYFVSALRSPVNGWLAWKKKPMEAICGAQPTFLEKIRIKKPDKHDSPDPACRCGFYGVKEIGYLLPQLNSCLSELWDHLAWKPLAIGRVALWGRLIEHEWGYRAQFAWPVEVWLFGPSHLPMLRWYGPHTIDEIPYDLVQKFLSEHYKISVHLGKIYPGFMEDQPYWDWRGYDGQLPPAFVRMAKSSGRSLPNLSSLSPRHLKVFKCRVFLYYYF